MHEDALAIRLIDAATAADRRRIAIGVSEQKAAELADEIRRTCIAEWSSGPVRVRRSETAIKALAKVHDTPDVIANRQWVTGIAEITRGRFESAVQAFDAAIATFNGLGRIADTARVQVAKLLALAMLSRYEEAIATGLAAVPVLESHGEELAAGKIEMNLSNIVSRRGLHREAEGFCSAARQRFIRAREPEWQAMAENGLANTYAELNDFRRAEQFYETARTTAISAGMLVTEAEIEASIGNLCLFRGRYADALRHLELSRRKFETLDMPHQTAIAELEIADIYAELNLNVEAVDIYVRVCNTFRKLKLRGEEARARLNFGRASLRIGEARTTATQLKKASKLFSAEQNPTGQASALLEQARLALGSGDHAAALVTANEAAGILKTTQNARLSLTADALAAQALQLGGAMAKAKRGFERVLAESLKLKQPDTQQLALTSLGKIDAAGGNVSAAVAKLKRAVSLVESLRAPLASEEFGMAFMAARIAPYDELARLYLAENRIAEAFRTVESGRSRSLVDALESSALVTGSKDEKAGELGRIREELNSYYKRLERAEPDEIDAIQKAVSEREASIAKLTRRIAAVTIAGLRATRTTDVKQIDAQLKGGTLVEFVELDGAFSAFVISGGKIHFFRDLASRIEIQQMLDDLHFQFGTLRYGMAGMEQFINQMKSRTEACLGNLYDRLVRPLERQLSGEKLVIVPAGSLYYVPFHALFDGLKYMVERFETIYAPSAGVWRTLDARPPRPIENSLLMAFADERIPLVETEIAAIRRLVPRPRLLSGVKATFSAFVRDSQRSGLIHLACHGQFRAENPMFSSLHLADGWVTVRDICSQRIEAELVTLSACESGLNKVHAGDEILGLARGFLTAGASSLIVSLWTVNDAAANQLMTDLYGDIQRGRSAAASLRQAQLKSIGREEHPFLWSPFVLIGR